MKCFSILLFIFITKCGKIEDIEKKEFISSKINLKSNNYSLK